MVQHPDAKNSKKKNMATEVVRDLADTIIGNNSLLAEDMDSNPSAETVIRAPHSLDQLGTTSSYVLTTQDSVFSRDMDHWMRGDSTPINTGVQGSRVTTAQRSTLVTSSSLDTTGVWYLAAMVLPFMSLNNTMLWRCTPSTVLSTAELILTNVARFCGQARSQLRRLAQEQAARDLFATAMDIVLVIYAMGFLVLSLYQASIIGH